ncbi:hypothetical protein FNV43_RR04754 [Rhamnella rubrinervis]|uniref:RING-type E3 ubiquitin transferase n=1 Tax=Rhamnella rubrinervis TaxID=2594499 RepID=A0A8K0HK63_9ROSA|nr:hypothetical protein FNV43_RR04754 [Rhamnella rubrinervis]
MDVVQEIAMARAQLMDKLSNSYSTYDEDHPYYHMLNQPEAQHVRLDIMTYDLALSRARETNRDDYDAVLKEVQLEVTLELGRILAKTMDPAFAGSKAVKVDEDDAVCSICHEELGRGGYARALGCMHMFHGYCLIKWLNKKTNCPLCRYQMKDREFEYKF